MVTVSGARTLRASTLLPLLATAACASVPNLGAAPQMRAASDYAASATLQSDGSAWPDQGWWLRYNDAQLTQLIEEGLAGSPDLAAAAARFRTAQGYAQRAGAALAPSVDAFGSGEVMKRGDHDANKFAKAGLSFSFDLDLWGKNRAALAASTSDAEAAGYELAQARLGAPQAFATPPVARNLVVRTWPAAHRMISRPRRSLLSTLRDRSMKGCGKHAREKVILFLRLRNHRSR